MELVVAQKEKAEYRCIKCGKVSPYLGEGYWRASFPGEDIANLRKCECPACKLKTYVVVIYLCPCGHRVKHFQAWHLVSDTFGLTSFLKEVGIKPKDLKPNSVKIGKLSIVVSGECPLGAGCESFKKRVDDNRRAIAKL